METHVKRISCPALNCKLSFTRRNNLNRHFERFHLNDNLIEKCLLCGQIFNSCEELQKHYKRFHKPSKKFFEHQSAFQKSVVTYRYNFDEQDVNLIRSQSRILKDIKHTILSEAASKTLVKTSLIIICQMSMLDLSGEKITSTLIPFRAPSFITNANTKSILVANIKNSFKFQEKLIDEFCNSGSNWVFDFAQVFDIEIAALKPILSGHETADESLTVCTENENVCVNQKTIKNHKYLFNPQNKDEKCFLYCLHDFLIQEPKFKSLTFERMEKKLNLKNISFPISIVDIQKFLSQNEFLDVKINILLRKTNGEIFPFEFGLGNGKKTLTLLLVTRKTFFGGSNHFFRITNVNKFLRQSYKTNNVISYKKDFFCLNCFNSFSSEQVLQKHENLCTLNKPRQEKFPDSPIILFKNFKNQHPLEFIAFLDFECVLPKTNLFCTDCKRSRCKCDRSFTHVVSSQIPIAYSFVILDQNSKIIHEKTYIGENAADNFVNHLFEQETLWIKDLLKQFKEIDMSEKQSKKFSETTNCYLCETFFDNNNIKCRDHCHFTGRFLGAACQSCNLERRKPTQLKIFLHNGSRYDFHFLVKALNDKKKVNNINILPYNGENFRTISFNSFVFVDSMSFLQSSLAQLSEDLSKTTNSYNILRQTYLVKSKGQFDQLKFNLVTSKSYFPYEYW